jgi:Holliday junction resolvase RusA-like endonuclease
MTNQLLAFYVEGLPETKGSWRSVRGRDDKPKFIPDNDREEGWATAVAWMARAELMKQRNVNRASFPLAVARVAIKIDFDLPVPKGKKHKRDIDKLARSVLDALQGLVYVDDEQVDILHLSKRRVDVGFGARIIIEAVG